MIKHDGLQHLSTMTQINQKLNLPINWEKVLIYSSSGICSLFLLGIVFKIRTLIVFGEVLVALFVLGLLSAIMWAIIKKFSVKSDNNS